MMIVSDFYGRLNDTQWGSLLQSNPSQIFPLILKIWAEGYVNRTDYLAFADMALNNGAFNQDVDPQASYDAFVNQAPVT